MIKIKIIIYIFINKTNCFVKNKLVVIFKNYLQFQNYVKNQFFVVFCAFGSGGKREHNTDAI